jgi:PAS domain S-box-containing protein
MQPSPPQLSDPARRAALARTGLLDSPPESAFDRLTRLATRVLGVPVSLVSLVDADRQFFKSAVGLAEPWASLRQTPLSHSFCQHLVGTGEPLVIPDARQDPRVSENLAIPDLGVAAYCGIPLRTRDGQVLGSFCAIDTAPRQWTPADMEVLADLAAAAMTEVELRARMAELRDSEARYRALVEQASDIIYQTDAVGRFTYVNPVAARIMGRPAGELVGMHFTELVHPRAREAVREFYVAQARDGVPGTYHEFPAQAGDGREVWIGQIVQLLLDRGELVGTQAVARDITARREVERMKDEFMAVVSHEVRTPLTALRASLGLVASGKLGELTEQGTRMVSVAVQNTDRLIRLVNDILDVERLASGKASLRARPSTADALVADALANVEGLAARAGITLQSHADPEPLVADPDRVAQVLVNLLSNAVKFSEAGTTVRAAARRDGAWVRFEVADQGRGIPADKVHTLFDRFQQVDLSDSRQKGGTGLGLAICKGIVEEHGGHIGVESADGAGSTFWFTLPASERDS